MMQVPSSFVQTIWGNPLTPDCSIFSTAKDTSGIAAGAQIVAANPKRIGLGFSSIDAHQLSFGVSSLPTGFWILDSNKLTWFSWQIHGPLVTLPVFIIPTGISVLTIHEIVFTRNLPRLSTIRPLIEKCDGITNVGKPEISVDNNVFDSISRPKSEAEVNNYIGPANKPIHNIIRSFGSVGRRNYNVRRTDAFGFDAGRNW